MKKLGFGMMRLPRYNDENGRNVDMIAVRKMVDEFIRNGFTYFDTAYMYHNYFLYIHKLLRKAILCKLIYSFSAILLRIPYAL